jgi:uncharacterized protein (DUF427 family)
MLAKATWEGVMIAQSDDCTVVDGYFYLPRSSVRMEYLQASDHTSVCGWKGVANYYDVVVNGKRNSAAASRQGVYLRGERLKAGRL